MTSVPFKQSNSYRAQGFALAIMGAVLFSLKAIVLKVAFGEGAIVEQMLALRMAFALPVYLVVLVMVRRRSEVSISMRDYMLAGALGVLGYYVCSWLDFTGLRFISAQLERLIMFVYPTITALLAWWFLGDRLTLRHGLALLLSYLGISILFGNELRGEGPYVLLGAALVFAAASLFAGYVIAIKPLIARMGSPLFTSVALSAASCAILLHFSIQATVSEVPPVTGSMIGLALILTVFCTLLPSFMMAEAIARIGPGLSSASGSVGPVATSVGAVLVLNEPFGLAHLLALGMTIAGILVLLTARLPADVKAPPE